MNYQLLQGDNRQVLRTLPDQSVHCIVTSPPYFGLRDYGVDGQIGLEETPAAYVAELVTVFRECWRVLRDDGTLFLNLGDSYFGSGKGRNADGSHQAGGKQGTNRGTVEGKLFKTGRANAQHVVSYGTSGKAPEGYRASDCLCGNLCDVCRVVYRNRKSHSDDLFVPMLIASLSAPTLASMGFESGHLPTWGSAHPVNRIFPAIRDLLQMTNREAEQLRAFQESMPDEFSQQLLDVCLQRGDAYECLLCARSLADCVRGCDGMMISPCDYCSTSVSTLGLEMNMHDRVLTVGASDSRILDKASDLTYPHYTTRCRQSQANLKPKDLIGIPWRVAFALQDDGWYLRSDIIWHKPNPMPESVTDRPTKAHEYIFLLTKRPRYYYDADAVKEPAVKGAAGSEFHTGKTGIHQLGRSSTKPRSKADSFKREGSKREQTIPGQGYGTHRPDREESDYDLETRNRRSVWTVPTSPYPGAHFATFPPALIEPCILAGCPEGGTVLDPFNGSGTTGAVACAHNRNYIGIDLSADYIELAHARIRAAIKESGRAYVAPVCKIDDSADMPLFQ